ncbi:MAG: AAA family ATPase [Hyphomicrobiaceae bacterium]
MTQQVVIDEVISVGARGGAIFSASTREGQRHRFVADGMVMCRPPVAGEVWEIGGTFRQHPRFGQQVHVAAAQLKRPSGRVIVSVLAKNPAFPGIGLARARKLYDELGDTLYEALDAGDVERLGVIIGSSLAYVVVEGWSQLAADAKTYEWLDRNGLPYGLARKLADIYGSEVAVKLENNPYRLLAFMSWKRTDEIGRALGVADDDERRLVAATEAVAYDRLAEAHTWAERTEMIHGVRDLLKCPLRMAEQAVDLAEEHYAFVDVEGGLQPLGPYSMEAFIAERCGALIRGEHEGAQGRLAPEMTSDEISNLLRAQSGSAVHIELTADQLRAVHMMISKPLSVLAGGAGVGKTTTLRAVHDLAREQMRPVWQMALSGKAARRMSEATGRPASTIASFLNQITIGRLDLTGDWILVVDEASMLDLPTLYRILRVMQPSNSLVLVGDPGQLPPIGFGLTFHALVEDNAVPHVELVEVHRQAASTGIPQAAKAIREGTLPDLLPFAGHSNGISFIETEPPAAFQTIADVLERLGGINEAQIIGSVKNGPTGIRWLNQRFHSMLAAGKPELGGFAVDEPVLWTVNDMDLQLLNGALGHVRGVEEGLTIAWDDGRTLTIPAERIGDLEHAYAITCHKGQGSQFRRVIVPVFHSRLLDRTLLYTAITRAEEQVVLVGDATALEYALAALPNPARRMTGIRHHLKRHLAPASCGA